MIDYPQQGTGDRNDPFNIDGVEADIAIQRAVDLTKRIIADRITGQRTASMEYIIVDMGPEIGPVLVCV